MIISEKKEVMVSGSTSEVLKDLKNTLETVRAALAREYDSKVADALMRNCFNRAMHKELVNVSQTY